MSPKHFTCFLGCIGGLSTALVITSIYRVPFSALRCFLQDTCFIRLQSATPDDETYHTEAVHSLIRPFLRLSDWDRFPFTFVIPPVPTATCPAAVPVPSSTRSTTEPESIREPWTKSFRH